MTIEVGLTTGARCHTQRPAPETPTGPTDTYCSTHAGAFHSLAEAVRKWDVEALRGVADKTGPMPALVNDSELTDGLVTILRRLNMDCGEFKRTGDTARWTCPGNSTWTVRGQSTFTLQFDKTPDGWKFHDMFEHDQSGRVPLLVSRYNHAPKVVLD